MFEANTVFVVGAGASAEFGLPVGFELANTIAELMSVDLERRYESKENQLILNIWNTFFSHDGDMINKCLKAAKRISEGIKHVDSIDQFLYIHADDEQIIYCGKTAIVRAILEAEKKSSLYYDVTTYPQMIEFEKFNDAWLKPFFSQLIDGRQKLDLDRVFRGITIICFNYDRCIEHYLIHALQKAYFIPAREAARLVALLEIYHPYGKVGELKTELNQQGVAFGADLGINEYIQTIKGIHTYTEQNEDVESLDRMKRAITNAKAIVFLGFAYHPQNMEILRPTGKRGKPNAIFGTAFEISDHGAKEAANLARDLISGGITTLEINNKLRCNPFLKHYQMSL